MLNSALLMCMKLTNDPFISFWFLFLNRFMWLLCTGHLHKLYFPPILPYYHLSLWSPACLPLLPFLLLSLLLSVLLSSIYLSLHRAPSLTHSLPSTNISTLFLPRYSQPAIHPLQSFPPSITHFIPFSPFIAPSLPASPPPPPPPSIPP